MTKFVTAAKKFYQGEEAATMVEYGLMLALIAVVCIAAIGILGQSTSTMFGRVNTAVTGAGATGTAS